jgi:type II secretory ATPase GspE/PulE/Tfp pilus assembly ATPase PilB-like protein
VSAPVAAFADLPEEFKKKLPFGKEVYKAKPMPDCPDGTKGRIAVYEVLSVDDDIQRMILKSPNESDIYDAARKKGMLTLKEDAILKSFQGVVPFSESGQL